MSFNFVNSCKVTRVSDAEAAAQSAIECTAVDMKRFRSVAFLLAMGSITGGAATSAKLQASEDNGVADGWSDLEGTSITIADDDDDQLFILEIDNPQKRYVRVYISRATQDSVVDGVIAVQFNADDEPVTQSDSVADSEYHHAPDEGTA